MVNAVSRTVRRFYAQIKAPRLMRGMYPSAFETDCHVISIDSCRAATG